MNTQTEHTSAAAVERAETATRVVGHPRDAIVGTTRSGEISSWNSAATRLYGYAADDIVGQSAETLVAPELTAEEAAILRRVLAGDDVQPYRATRVCHDGTSIAVSVALSPIVDAAGVIVGTVAASCRDDSPPDARTDDDWSSVDLRPEPGHPAGWAGVHTDEHGQQSHDAHARFQARMDVERAKERVQVRDAEDQFQVRMDVERATEQVQVRNAQERFQVGMDAERAKERVQVRDAEVRFQHRMSAELDEERTQVHEAHSQFQVRMDAELREAQKDNDHLQSQLEQSQRLEALGQLAGGVAHDFNNLLAVIINYAAFVSEELAARPASDLTAAARDVQQIQRAADRAAVLTHQLLAFARREVVQPRVLDLNNIVRDVQQLLDRTIGDDVVLQTQLAPDLWPVLADSGQIEQILVNLAVNARDAMGDGGTLRIDTANIDVATDFIATGSPVRAGRHVQLRVSDTGSGIPADVLEHVFEPFYTTKPDGTGTGLGLATVYGIVGQAGATIDIHSLPGVGTAFTILIPVTDEQAGPVEEPLPYQRTPKGETVMVVEDQDALREVTERIFTSNGYNVITAANGLEALTVANQYDADIHLLVTDVVMPHMLGKEVAERIRQIKPDIEVLFMSGYAQPVLASRGRLDPGVNLIDKPFSASALIERAGQILNGHFQGFSTVKPEEATPPPEAD